MTSSQKSMSIANRYKEGFKKMVDARILKREVSLTEKIKAQKVSGQTN